MKLRNIFPLLTAVALFAAACGGDDQSDLDREMDLALAEDSLAELGDTASADAEAPVEQPRTQPAARPQQPAAGPAGTSPSRPARRSG